MSSFRVFLVGSEAKTKTLFEKENVSIGKN